MICPPDILDTRIKNTKLISLAIEAYGVMSWVTATVSYLDIWKEILTDPRISEMLGISADDDIDAGVPNSGFTL